MGSYDSSKRRKPWVLSCLSQGERAHFRQSLMLLTRLGTPGEEKVRVICEVTCRGMTSLRLPHSRGGGGGGGGWPKES